MRSALQTLFWAAMGAAFIAGALVLACVMQVAK